MPPVITSDVVVAYAQCPRKAYLLLFSPEQGVPHEYTRLLEQQRHEHQAQYLDHLQHTHTDVQPYTVENLANGSPVLLKACLQAHGLVAMCDVLTRVKEPSPGGQHRYEPTLCVGTHSISPEQKLALAFTGYVLGRLQHTPPMAGRLITMDGTSHTMKLDPRATALLPLLDALHTWTTDATPEPPPIILNKHCPLCPFQGACHAQAEQEDNLSLLDGVTARVIRQYEKKGIFTVKQLSYLFKPRKPKKRSRKPPPVTHKIELQALAIREQKIYLHELPVLSRQPVELFVDMEGVPDRGLYYLMGVLVCQGDSTKHYTFWADTDQDERHMWQLFVDKITQYPEAPLYHYGSYEPRAIATLAKRYDTDAESVTKRLVNVNRHIYGKVYFPVWSNGLKDIGHFIGAQWTSPQASGLQSLVWRHHWEKTQDATYQDMLVTYNREDCHVLKLLVEELSKIQRSADTLSGVDYADKRKQPTTEISKEINSQFSTILRFAHFNYDKKKISFRQSIETNESAQDMKEKKKYAGHMAKQRIMNIEKKVKRIIKVERGKVCPKCGHKPLRKTERMARRTIIDLALTKNGLRKTLIQYEGLQGYCIKCQRFYSPPEIRKYRNRELYGDGFKAWIVYQRIALRMSYGSILESAEEYFGEKITSGRLANFIRNLGQRYAENEKTIIQHLLESPFIHADETKVNIQGVNQYVWVFTDGQYVVFKLTETRESTIVHELLKNYAGTLISDFYPGYDAVPCKQQKCWVHLIRNLNDDLLESPFDKELEFFALEVKNLIIPIMDAVQRYGLKKHNLNKFKQNIDSFYKRVIIDIRYKSDLTNQYQKLFVRYQDSLFTFIDQDGIPWHNNTAERAIRHISKQRAISTNFHASVMKDYLILLGIRQACRFQGKSFFKFLFSGETDLEKFEARKRKR
jgi:predicted RecB family nuclease